MKWISIDKLGEYVKGRQMFVVKAFDVLQPHATARKSKYTTDPYCVWVEFGCYDEQFPEANRFILWPHSFMPTHFCLLPEEREE